MPLEKFKHLPQNEQTKELYRIAKNFWTRSTRRNNPIRDDGFADGAGIFLVFNPRTWRLVQRQKVAGVFSVRNVSDEKYDLLDARKLDYTLMTEDFLRRCKICLSTDLADSLKTQIGSFTQLFTLDRFG